MSTANHDGVKTFIAYLTGLQVLNFQVPASAFLVVFGRFHAEHFMVELNVTSKVKIFGVQFKILVLAVVDLRERRLVFWKNREGNQLKRN